MKRRKYAKPPLSLPTRYSSAACRQVCAYQPLVPRQHGVCCVTAEGLEEARGVLPGGGGAAESSPVLESRGCGAGRVRVAALRAAPLCAGGCCCPPRGRRSPARGGGRTKRSLRAAASQSCHQYCRAACLLALRLPDRGELGREDLKCVVFVQHGNPLFSNEKGPPLPAFAQVTIPLPCCCPGQVIVPLPQHPCFW